MYTLSYSWSQAECGRLMELATLRDKMFQSFNGACNWIAKLANLSMSSRPWQRDVGLIARNDMRPYYQVCRRLFFLILNCGFKTLLHIYVLILRKAKIVTLEIITDFLMQFVSLHGDLMSLALPISSKLRHGIDSLSGKFQPFSPFIVQTITVPQQII